jgi:hypothetical protein
MYRVKDGVEVKGLDGQKYGSGDVVEARNLGQPTVDALKLADLIEEMVDKLDEVLDKPRKRARAAQATESEIDDQEAGE